MNVAMIVERWNSAERPLFKGKLIDEDGCKCAQGDGRDGEVLANARLIAAAPDLLAACKDLIRLVDADHAEPVELARCWFDDIRTAIAKAGGGA